ncbi:MAG: AraC family transcriptional regulator, partial [Spirochaetaceae bacterium]|nr:AraC family transcriptional regulator [Spirochaetaceae bacterium]
NEGMNFRAYLNGLRLDEFLRVAGISEKSLNYLEMAMASGFSSKTTFLRAFRAKHGTTPADYFSSRGADSHTADTSIHTGTT